MSVVFAVLVAVGLSFLVLVLSSIVVSIVASRFRGRPEIVFGVLMQVMIMVFTLLIVFLVVKNPSILGTLSFPLIGFVEAVALAGLASLLISFLGTRITEECKPPIELRVSGSLWF